MHRIYCATSETTQQPICVLHKPKIFDNIFEEKMFFNKSPIHPKVHVLVIDNVYFYWQIEKIFLANKT